jgi:hypothetical protein
MVIYEKCAPVAMQLLLYSPVVGRKTWMLFFHGYQEYHLAVEASVKLLLAKVSLKH